MYLFLFVKVRENWGTTQSAIAIGGWISVGNRYCLYSNVVVLHYHSV